MIKLTLIQVKAAKRIRIADAVPINYTWAPLGSVPYKTGPSGLFTPQHTGPFMSIEVLLSMILLELCVFWEANLLQLPVEE